MNYCVSGSVSWALFCDWHKKYNVHTETNCSGISFDVILVEHSSCQEHGSSQFQLLSQEHSNSKQTGIPFRTHP